MAPPKYTLHAPPGAFRAFPALIAAEYNGLSVTVADPFDASKVAALSPTGKAPVLETPGGGTALSGSHAIARFLANVRRDTGLTGSTLHQGAAIDAWMDFAAQELELPACVWFYPVAGYMPFHKEAYEKAKSDLASGLKQLDDALLLKTYLVGEDITLADIVVASTLLYPLKLVCDKAYLKPYPNVVRWFTTCVHQPEFVAVIGDVTLCQKELLAPGQEASASASRSAPAGGAAPKEAKKKEKGGGGGGGGEKKKKEKKEEAAAEEPLEPAPEKKADHPYKIMDKDSPSPFIMDAWKKTYSNCATYEAAMEEFWKTFDKEGWSLWHQLYNYNEENKRIFMTCNAVGGFQQRTDEIRRWAFGVMDVLGTEETVLEIKGVWLLRGDTVEHMIAANDDANWYTWTKLAGKDLEPTDEVKALVHSYWCSENELEGKPIQDSKVFK